jgi:hypothetical protein
MTVVSKKVPAGTFPSCNAFGLCFLGCLYDLLPLLLLEVGPVEKRPGVGTCERLAGAPTNPQNSICVWVCMSKGAHFLFAGDEALMATQVGAFRQYYG